MHTSQFSAIALSVAAFLGSASFQATAVAQPASVAGFAETKAKAVVSIKMSLKYEGSFGEQERETEIVGVVIDPSGLVLCANSQSGGVPPSMASRMSGVTVTPREIKVLVGDDSEGLDAKLIARDSELDLAWVKITDTKGAALAAVDLGTATTPSLGDELVSIGRLSKFFDRATMLTFCRVSAITKKPRHLIMPSDMNDLGIPVFTTGGGFVGVTIVQLPEADEDDEQNVRAQLRGLGASMVILPAAEVAEATRRAMETAAKPEAKPDDKPQEKPADQ